MARYILVRVESNESADKLLEKFKAVPAIQLVGLFVSPAKFCPGKEVCGSDRTLIRSRKWGTTHCRVCKLPVSTIDQSPRNLLDDPDIHPRYNTARLTVREPWDTPTNMYGVEIIEQGRAQLERGKETMRKHKLKQARGRTRRTRRITH